MLPPWEFSTGRDGLAAWVGLPSGGLALHAGDALVGDHRCRGTGRWWSAAAAATKRAVDIVYFSCAEQMGPRSHFVSKDDQVNSRITLKFIFYILVLSGSKLLLYRWPWSGRLLLYSYHVATFLLLTKVYNIGAVVVSSTIFGLSTMYTPGYDCGVQAKYPITIIIISQSFHPYIPTYINTLRYTTFKFVLDKYGRSTMRYTSF